MFPTRRKARATVIVAVPAAVLAVGLFVGHLQSTEWRWRRPSVREIVQPTELEPVRALPRTAAVLATVEAEHLLRTGRPYAAWEVLRDHIDGEDTAGAVANLLAARAAAEWGGWSQVRSVLAGRNWLTRAADGEGLYLLARAEEELGNLAAAEAAYRAYLAMGHGAETGAARGRYAEVLSRLGRHTDAARAFEAAAAEMPEIADWMRLRSLESMYAAGDPAAASAASRMADGSAPVRMRLALLESAGLEGTGNPGRAIYRLEWEARILRAAGARVEAAQLELVRARLLEGTGNAHRAREVLRSVASDVSAQSAMRVAAADALGAMEPLTGPEQVARAEAYAGAGRVAEAADALGAALEKAAAVPDSAALRLRRADLLYEARQYVEARREFALAAGSWSDAETRARAELFAARSLFRSAAGRNAAATRRSAVSELERVVERYPGTAAAGTALFLLGDESANTQAALAYYRRAAAIEHSPDAREALYRVGDRSLRLGDTGSAARAWEEYIYRYPRGDQTARVAYDLAKLHDAAGRRSQARAMYAAALSAEPTSYWSFRASEHLSIAPLANVLSELRPWAGLASEPVEAAEVLRRMDLLAAVGLTDARQREYQAAVRAFERMPLATLILAEGLRDRGETVEAMRLARLLLERRGGEWDERLLRVVYPFPYRELIVAESERAGVDPMLYAGLVRQESTFRPAIRSRVGATGLGQIMPATGRWLAPSVGIRNYDDSLLEVPEVNVRMGTKYLGDLLVRYDGATDLALAGYNAGPGRADRWRRQFGYGRDIDAFRAAIPFDETRNYVMIVLRNAAIYEGLYGESGVVMR